MQIFEALLGSCSISINSKDFQDTEDETEYSSISFVSWFFY